MRFSALIFMIVLANTAAFSADGKTMYEACIKCHGKQGESTAFSRAIGGWDKGQVRQALREYRAGKRNLRGQGSIMRQRVAGYSDAQIDALASYIASLK